MPKTKQEVEKIERKIPNLEILWEKIDTLITDDQIDTSVKTKLKKQGVKLICAKTK